MIITKAVSRFARNLLDCIGYIEELSNLDPPVRVFFEAEQLDTSVQTSGVILFVLAMVAEEESHMKSEAILWRCACKKNIYAQFQGSQVQEK